MPMPMSMLLAQSGIVDPETRAGLMRLASSQAADEAAATALPGSVGSGFASLLKMTPQAGDGVPAAPPTEANGSRFSAILQTNPVFQPAEEQSFSLAGNAPIGGGASGIGSALLGNAPPQAAEQASPQPRPRKKLQDTESYKRFGDTLKEYKGLSWLAPRAEKEKLLHTLEAEQRMMGVELAWENGEDESAQKYANLLRENTEKDRARTASLKRLTDEREAAERSRWRIIGSSLYDTETDTWTNPPKETDIGSGKVRNRYLTAGGAVYDTETGKWSSPPERRSAAPRPTTSKSVSSPGPLSPQRPTPASTAAPAPPITAIGPDGKRLVLRGNEWVPLR